MSDELKGLWMAKKTGKQRQGFDAAEQVIRKVQSEHRSIDKKEHRRVGDDRPRGIGVNREAGVEIR